MKSDDEVIELLKLVDNYLDALYKNEKYLFDNGVCERNLVFHFARYFCLLIQNCEKYSNLSVDYEYNRDAFNEQKYKAIMYYNEKHKIYPDFIFHERGNNENNMLAIEFKKYNNNHKNGLKNDYLKLEAITSQKSGYKYKIGLSIKFGISRDKVIIKKFVNGMKVV